MVCVNVASDSPMVVSDPLGGFYYLWWDPYAQALVLAPECLEMRKVIGQTYAAWPLEQPNEITADFLNMIQEEILHLLELDGDTLCETPRSMDRRATTQIIEASPIILPDGRMTPPNASLYIGLSEKTLAMKRCDGTGPQFTKIGGKVFYFKADVDAWINDAGRHLTTEEER